MKICFTGVDGKRHCFYIPIYQIPFTWPPVPHPENYDLAVTDITIVGSILEVAKKIDNERVRETMMAGVKEAFSAIQKNLGEGVTLTVTEMER